MLLDPYLTARETIAAEMNANYMGVANLLLMESAGSAVADAVVSKVKPGGKVFVACGLGGNGGDGFVASRHLAGRGYDVEVVLAGKPESIHSNETRHNYEVASLMGSIKTRIVEDASLVTSIEADAVVDALVGYTYHGGMNPVTAAIIKAINTSNAYTFSVDVPTGMVVDTGDSPGECVEADTTVTFHKPKFGYAKRPRQLGKLIVAKIGLPPEAELYTGPGDVYLVNKQREAESHKGMFGRLLVVGGSETYHGAPSLVSLGAQATGVDLVYAAVPETAAPGLMSIGPDMIVVKLAGDHLTTDNIAQLDPFLARVDALAIGPGLNLADETKEASLALITAAEKRKLPMIIDADALKAFGEKPRKLKVPVVFTPHSREFEILTGKIAQGDWRTKGAIVEAEAKRLGAAILLKGSVDVISDGFHTRYNWTGNPGMTVGGTGDVLTGIVGGYIAQGASVMEAACAGAFINGGAGDLVYTEKGYHIQASDLIPLIPRVIEDAISGEMRT